MTTTPGEHDRRARTNRQAEADKRKRTGEEQTDKNRPAEYPCQVLIISNIRVPLVFYMVELYSQLAGNVFPPHWEYVPNVPGTCSQLSGNIGRKRNRQSHGFYLRDLSGVRGRKVTTPLTPVNESRSYKVLACHAFVMAGMYGKKPCF